MADLKISQLTGAATPLAGTEVVPIVQSGGTKKVSVADLTAGRAVDTAALNASGLATLSAGVVVGNGSFAQGKMYTSATNGLIIAAKTGSTNDLLIAAAGGNAVITVPTNTEDVKIALGNLVVGTAAKGIDFSANTPAAGMTSELLDWYEEGTWTPDQGAGLTVVGTFSSSGKYTRIGRQVTVAGQFDATTSVSAAASAICCTNLPFSAATAGLGSMTDAAVSASSTCLTSAANLYVITAIAATTTIYFSVTYFV